MDRIEPRIHDEIKDYKEKFYNFTLRQWLFGILLIITIVPLYLSYRMDSYYCCYTNRFFWVYSYSRIKRRTYNFLLET